MSALSVAAAGVGSIRRWIGRTVLDTVTAGPLSEDQLAGLSGDEGLFGPDSVTWRVHADPAIIVGGVSALLLQTAHPLAMAAAAEHSNYKTDALGRLRRTHRFIAATTFGTSDAAEDAIERVRRIHTTVHGTAPDGRPYRADDPRLLAWVHVAEVDSFLRGYQRYGRERLTLKEADRYLEEMATIASRLGAEEVPTTVAGVERWIVEIRPELVVGEQAREAVQFVLHPPLPYPARLAYPLIALAAVNLLPDWVRDDLGVPRARLDAAVRLPAATLVDIVRWGLEPVQTNPPRSRPRASVRD